jgi:hypothetical protein
MPARMWKYGIYYFLELLHHRPHPCMEIAVKVEYPAYQIMSLLYENALYFEDAWIECLGQLVRYRTAVEEDNLGICEDWAGVPSSWCSKAANRILDVGRLYHHLAILARPHHLQQLYFHSGALISQQLFLSTRNSIHVSFKPVLQKHCPSCTLLELDSQSHTGLFCLSKYYALGDLDIPSDILHQSHVNRSCVSPCHHWFHAEGNSATKISYSFQLKQLAVETAGRARTSSYSPPPLPQTVRRILRFTFSTILSLICGPSPLRHIAAVLSVVNSANAQYDGATQTLAGYSLIHKEWLQPELLAVAVGGIGYAIWNCLSDQIRSSILSQVRAHQRCLLATSLGILAAELILLDTWMKQIDCNRFDLAQKM